MKRHWMIFLSASVLLLVAGGLPAEIDRKKVDAEKEKQARPEMDTEAGDDSHRRFHERIAKEGEENLKEIQRLLDEINGSLAKQNTGSATQARQKQAVEKMKKLISELSKGCKQCSGSGSSSKPSGSPKDKKPSGEKDGQDKKKQGEARENQKQLPSAKQKQEKKCLKCEESKKRTGQKCPECRKEDNRDKVPNNRVAEDELPESGSGSLSGRIKKIARWGFLPPKVTEEMLSASSKEAPPEYRVIIDRYYKRLSDYYDHRRRSRERETK